FQTINAGFNGLEIGEHSAQPALGHIVLAALGGGFFNRLDRLFFGADKNHASAFAGHFGHEVGGVFRAHDGFLQVDNVNAPTIRINIRLHFGVPTLGLVTEVHSRVEHVFHGDLWHRFSSWLSHLSASR